MNKLKLLMTATLLATVIPSSHATMNMSGLPAQMKAFYKGCGYKDTSSAEYKAQKAKQQLEHAQDCAYNEVIDTMKQDIINKLPLENKEGYWKWYNSYANELRSLVNRGQYSKVSAYDEQKVWIDTKSADDIMTFGDTKVEVIKETENLYAEYNTEYISVFEDKLKKVLAQKVKEAFKEKEKLEKQKKNVIDYLNLVFKDVTEDRDMIPQIISVYQDAEYIKIKLKDQTKECVITQHPNSLDGKMTVYYSNVEYISEKLSDAINDFIKSSQQG